MHPTKKAQKMKPFMSLGLAVLATFGLTPTGSALAEQIKVAEKCGPAVERTGPMNADLSKPWAVTMTAEPNGPEAIFKRETKGVPGTSYLVLSSQGRGMVNFSGFWERASDGRRNTYAPVSLVADAFPLIVKTRYLMGDGYRECELVFGPESGRPLKVAEVLKGLPSKTATQSAQIAQGQVAAAQPTVPPSDGRIDQNAAGVTQNRQDIGVNRQGIAQNQQDIGVNRQGIAQNQQNIAVNSGRIDQNAAGVTKNRQDIGVNRQGIAQNQQDIGVNRQGIAQNQQNIADNQQEMKSRTTLVNEKYSKPVTGTAETWATYMSGVPFQQNQFCRIIQNWREELSLAQQQRNQIKENIAHRTREQRLTALMPDGNFQNWIVRAVSVKQASDGSAAVLFEMPCDVVIGSHACGLTPKTFIGTIPENSRLYSELVSISVGDFLGVSGSFSFIDEKAAFKKDRSVASFTTMKAGTHCDAKVVAKPESEFYASQVMTLSTLK
jgi:hypothetical protein